MTPWEKVVAATEGHNIEKVKVHLTEGGPWVWYRCSCDNREPGDGEDFVEPWEFTDHIRRIVFAVLDEAVKR